MKILRVKKYFLFSFFFLLFSFFRSAAPVYSLDYDAGLLTSQYFGIGNDNPENEALFGYRGDIQPNALFLFEDMGDFKSNKLIVTANVSFGYEEKDTFFIFEFLETAYSVKYGEFRFKAGRMPYSDPLFTADGLFDGVQVSHASDLGSFSFGTWYTGLLYKKSANIFMTDKDKSIYIEDSYFAPSRLLASLDWTHLSFQEFLRMQAAVTMQFDLNGENDKLHSQYFTLKTGMFYSDFLFEVGGSIETLQAEHNNAIAFAWETGTFWTVPTEFKSRLSFSIHSAGGGVNDSIAAFVPINAVYYTEIFQPLMSGITALCLGYQANVLPDLGASADLTYFVRNDLGTYQNLDLDDSGYLMGAEFFVRAFWNPVSDVQVSLGSGIFVPSMGNAWKNAKNQWHIDLTALLALY